jgi:hypothetical protein
MSKRIDKSWIVFSSIENFEGNRCVDLFRRPDGTYGFEEFRRDPEDAGSWTPVQFYSGKSYAFKDDVLAAATSAVTWLEERLPRRHANAGSCSADTASASALSTAVSKGAPGDTKPPDTRPSRKRS